MTLTKFFLEPMQHIGVALSALIRGLLEDMPIFMWPISIAFAMSLIIFTLLIVSRYRLRFLWNVFQLEPAPLQAHGAIQDAQQNQQATEAIQDVQQNQQTRGAIQHVQQNQQTRGAMQDVQQNQQTCGAIQHVQQNQKAHEAIQDVQQNHPPRDPSHQLLELHSSGGQDENSLGLDVDQLQVLAIGTEQCGQAHVTDDVYRHCDTSNEQTLEPEGVDSDEEDHSVKHTTTVCIVAHPDSAQSSLTESLQQPTLLQSLGPLSGNEHGDDLNHTDKQAVPADHQSAIPAGATLAPNTVQNDVGAQGDGVIPSTLLESADNLDLITLGNGEFDVQPPIEDAKT